jgi:hypothetical protein
MLCDILLLLTPLAEKIISAAIIYAGGLLHTIVDMRRGLQLLFILAPGKTGPGGRWGFNACFSAGAARMNVSGRAFPKAEAIHFSSTGKISATNFPKWPIGRYVANREFVPQISCIQRAFPYATS